MRAGGQPPSCEAIHPLPGEPVALAAAPERLEPEPCHLRPEGRHRVDVAGHGVVGEVPSHHACQPSPLFGDGLMPASPESVFDLCSFARIRFEMVMRLSQKRPSLVFPQKCVKPRKSNVSGLPRPRAAPVLGGVAPELDEAGLVGMQFQVELREPLTKVAEELLGIDLMLEPDHKVISKPHDDHVTLGVPPSSIAGPTGRRRSGGRR